MVISPFLGDDGHQCTSDQTERNSADPAPPENSAERVKCDGGKSAIRSRRLGARGTRLISHGVVVCWYGCEMRGFYIPVFKREAIEFGNSEESPKYLRTP